MVVQKEVVAQFELTNITKPIIRFWFNYKGALMAKYKVFYERREVEYAIIEANSAEEAEELADTDYSSYDWKHCDGTMDGEILVGESEGYSDV